MGWRPNPGAGGGGLSRRGLALLSLSALLLFFFLLRLLGRRPDAGALALLGPVGLAECRVVLEGRGQGRVGPGLQKGAKRVAGSAYRREHERGSLGEGIAGVDVGAVGGKQGHDCGRVGVGREVHGRDPGAGEDVRIGPLLEDQPRHLGAASAAGQVQRRVTAQAGRRPRGRTRVQERARDLDIVADGGPVERGPAVALGGIYVGPVPEQGAHHLQVAALGRVRDR